MNKAGVVIALVIVAVLGLIAYSTFSASPYRVKACMTFKGQTACKIVKGKSEKGALETAITGACADIASGVTDTINCTQSQPSSVEWLAKK